MGTNEEVEVPELTPLRVAGQAPEVQNVSLAGPYSVATVVAHSSDRKSFPERRLQQVYDGTRDSGKRGRKQAPNAHEEVEIMG